MDIVQIVIQAGGVGVAVYAIHALVVINTNHLKHSEEANRLFTEAIGKLTEAINLLREKIK